MNSHKLYLPAKGLSGLLCTTIVRRDILKKGMIQRWKFASIADLRERAAYPGKDHLYELRAYKG